MRAKSFSRLVEPHLDAVHRLCRRLTRTRADAEDLAQAALLRAFERHDELRDPARVRPWLLTLTRHLHLNRVRDVRPHLVVLDGGRLTEGTDEEPRGNLEDELQDRSLSDELLGALRALPEEQSTALWLREVEGLAYDEIADVLGCPVGTVRSRLARARQAMFDQLASTSLDRASEGAKR